MNFFNKRLLSLVLVSAALTACSSDDDEDVENSVAELTEIVEQFKPQVVWDTSVGDGVEHYFSRLSPVVAYDHVYVADRQGYAMAFEQKTGKQVWKVDLSNLDNERGFFDDKKSARISGGAVAGYNKVFWGSENGDVFALDSKTGELKWHTTVPGEVISKPALEGNKVIINTVSGILIALDSNTGEMVWKVDQAVPALTLRGVSGVTTSAGGAFVGLATGEVSVYLLDSGQQGWTTEIGEASGSTELQRIVDVDVTPIVYGEKVYSISANGNLVATDLRTGRELWKRKYSSYRQLSVEANKIYATDIQGHVYAIDRNSGAELWSQLSLTNRGTTGPVVQNGYIVVGDFEGYLHWLDIDNGDIVARHHVDGSGLFVTPIVEDGVLYAYSRDGSFEAIQTSKAVSEEN